MVGSALLRRRHVASAAALCAVSLSPAAHAQGINYAELEELFGEPVTTSVTGKPQRASDAPAAIIIITRDDIRRSPATDIPGLLNAYAGIDVARWTAGQSDVVIRGGVRTFDSRLLVMVNGRQVYLDHYGMTNWAGIGVQLSEIQQIEVVPGPNSALFGFNAVSGVVNIITVNPLQRQQVATSVEVGTQGYLKASQSAALKLKDWLGLRLSGGYERSDELDGLASSRLAPVEGIDIRPSHKEISGEVYIAPASQTEASFSGTYTDSRHVEVPDRLVGANTRYRFTALSGQLSHNTGWGALSLRAFRNTSDIAVDTELGKLELANAVFVASTAILVRAGSADTLRAGLEYRHNSLVMSGQDHIRYRVYAGNGMWEHQFGDIATFTTAVRVDSLQLTNEKSIQPTLKRSITEWSANAALLFKLGAADTLRLAGGRGVQAPSLFSLGVPPGGAGREIVPSIIHSGEVGLTHALNAINGQAEVTAFYNHTTDVITGLQNVGSFSSLGVTASVAGRFDPSWSWMLNYSWTHIEEDVPANSGGNLVYPIALDRSTPAHKLKAQLSYEAGPWLATVAARYTSPTQQVVAMGGIMSQTLSLVSIDDTLAFDARFVVRINDHLTATVAGENLTGADDVSLSPAGAQRLLRAGLELRF